MDFSTLYFRVDDITSAGARVKALGGTASDIKEYPSGLNATCTDDQGTKFCLWQPAAGF
jgi:predicted enzyme related to lactoylglutathione lyase